MDLITAATSEHLLATGLEQLHWESEEWISEIEFWKDETAFLYTLVISKTLRSIPVSAKELVEKIESELTSITGRDLDVLMIEVREHEKLLGQILTKERTDVESYRARHYVLSRKLMDFKKRIRELKRTVFLLADVVSRENNRNAA